MTYVWVHVHRDVTYSSRTTKNVSEFAVHSFLHGNANNLQLFSLLVGNFIEDVVSKCGLSLLVLKHFAIVAKAFNQSGIHPHLEFTSKKGTAFRDRFNTRPTRNIVSRKRPLDTPSPKPMRNLETYTYLVRRPQITTVPTLSPILIALYFHSYSNISQ
jgi:hypothetical protein